MVLFFFAFGTALLALLLVGVTLFFLLRREQKLRMFLAGKDGRDLEAVLLAQIARADHLDRELNEVYTIIESLRQVAAKSLHRVALERFNPFNDVGGDQSFSVALLDGENTGIVISSLHTREGTRVYGKPIVRGAATNYPLTDEERAVIGRAGGNRRLKS